MNTAIEVRQYTNKTFLKKTLDEFIHEEPNQGTKVTWVNVNHLSHIVDLETLPQFKHVHPILTSNLRLVNQRSKLEVHEDYAYFVCKLMHVHEGQMDVQQLSILMFKDCLITITEHPHDAFDEIKQRLDNPHDVLRQQGQDYLLYTILDDIVDDYNQVLDELTEVIDEDEVKMLKTPTMEMMQSMQSFKKSLFVLYRGVWPIREILNRIIHGEIEWISPVISQYHRDILDHLFQVLDVIDLYREIVSSMMEVYLSSLSIRMNEIMKVLTIISTIFIPLTFIVGLYGMNFKYMPEYTYVYAYPLLWVVMILIAVSMFIFFKRKKWF